MARGNFPLYALNAGEVSKIALGRVDVAKLRLAAQAQVNFMPWAIGPMMLRPGLNQVGEILNDAPCTLINFVYSKFDTAQLELIDGIMRVRINDVLISRGSVATVVLDPTFTGTGSHWATTGTTAGCSATVTGGVATLTPAAVGGVAQIGQTLSIASGDQNNEHGLRVVVSNGPVTIRIGSAAGLSDYLAQSVIDTGTHSLAFTPTAGSAYLQICTNSGSSTNGTGASNVGQQAVTLTGCTIESAGVLEIPTTWAVGDLPNLRPEQSGDVIYVACQGQQQRKIERRGVRPGARGWSFVLYRSDNGPFQESPAITANFTPSVYTGNGTLTSDQPYFQSGHVGALFRVFSPGQVYSTLLGALGAFTEPMRIAGVGNDRVFGVITSGTWSGTLTLQRSLVGPNEGFAPIANITTNTTTENDDSSSLDNVIAWYRVGFVSAGDYVSGAAAVHFAASSGGEEFGPSTGGAAAAGGKWATCRVTGYTSPTVVSIEVLDPFSVLTPNTIWQESAWSGVNGWPTTVKFHEGRLGWYGPGPIPIAQSQSNDYTGYAEEDNTGASFGDSAAILEDFGSGPVDFVSWAFSGLNLVMGREMEISSARSSSFGAPLTPSDFGVHPRDSEGAYQLPIVALKSRGVFVQQSGRRIYELYWDGREFDYSTDDLTKLNIDIGKPQFVDIAVAQQPDKQVFLPRTDGQCAVMLREIDEEVTAFWRMMTLGVIEKVRVLPSATGIEDQVYFVVRRIINGVTKRFLEKLAVRDNCVGGSLNEQLDCALVYSGAAVSTLQASWLPLTTITVWADGAAIGTTTTDGSGNFTMPDGKSHSNVVAGLGGVVIVGSTNTLLPNNVAPAQVFSAAQGTLTVGTQYNGFPCEVWADIGATGRPPQHMGSLVVANGVVTLPNNQVASTIVRLPRLRRDLPVGQARLRGAGCDGARSEEEDRPRRPRPLRHRLDRGAVRPALRPARLDAAGRRRAGDARRHGVVGIRRPLHPAARHLERRRPAVPPGAGAEPRHHRRRRGGDGHQRALITRQRPSAGRDRAGDGS